MIYEYNRHYNKSSTTITLHYPNTFDLMDDYDVRLKDYLNLLCHLCK